MVQKCVQKWLKTGPRNGPKSVENGAQKWSKPGPQYPQNRVRNLDKTWAATCTKNGAIRVIVLAKSERMPRGVLIFLPGRCGPYVHSKVHSVTSEASCGLDFHLFTSSKILGSATGTSGNKCYYRPGFSVNGGLAFGRMRSAIWSPSGTKPCSKNGSKLHHTEAAIQR